MFVKQEIWYPNINKTRNRHGKEFIMKIITAIDSFKGSMTSMEAGQAAAEGIGCRSDRKTISRRRGRYSRGSCIRNERNITESTGDRTARSAGDL